MKLIIDVGNTNIVVGLFNEKNTNEAHASFRLATPAFTTTDELALKFKQLLAHHALGLQTKKITASAFTSVVPNINHNITKLMNLYFQQDILEITHEMFSGFTLNYNDHQDIGIDRLVNLKAASYLNGGTSAIVIDYGTAVTIDVLKDKNFYAGGIIIPGISVSLEALIEHTSKLPSIELKRPKDILGNSTKSGMQNGVYYLYSLGINAIIAKIANENFSNNSFTLTTTGGFARFIGNSLQFKHTINPHLTLIGGKIILDEQLALNTK